MRTLLILIAALVSACGAQATPVPPTRTPEMATATPAGATATLTSAPMTVPADPRPSSTSSSAPTNAPPAADEYTDGTGNRIRGRADAPVTITDYSDFL